MLFLGFVFFSLHSHAQTKNEIEKINSILGGIETSYDKIPDIVSFINQEAKKHGLKDKSIQQIIVYNLEAQKTADLSKGINTKSTTQFLKAINLAEKKKLQHLQTWSEISYAFYLYTYREIKDAYPYFLKNIKRVEMNDYEFKISPAVSYKKVGYFLNNINEFQKSNVYLLRAEKISANPTSIKSALHDNIAINYWHQKKYDSAGYHYNIAEEIALKTNDKLRYAKILGNRALISIDLKKYDEAENFLLKDINITEKIQDEKNMMFAKALLARLYLKIKRYNDCQKYADEALKIADSSPYYKSEKLEILDLRFQLAKIKEDAQEELFLRREMDRTSEDLKKMDGQENINQINWKSRQEIFELKIDAEKSKAEKASIQKTLAIILSGCLLLTVFFFRHRIKDKYKIDKSEYDKKILALMLEKANSENRLNTSRKTIDTFKTYLREKNKQIEELESTVSNINNFSKSYMEEKTTVLQSLLQSHLMTAENWDLFKTNFMQEYPEFYKNITDNFDDLTEANLRMIFLTKLDLKNTEIARILGVTLEAVKKSKQRLRKKYSGMFDELYQ
ncbi:tetratricopeptide repeat protein [Kaistella faecalis]|uniref:tetratricopeptide repeat protein n=1 Tax=Kaistella faecalis TaxID=2852098 RepID=UPI001C45EF58|nr:hypothetical protein [Chryseobacterium faecale]UFK98730.1 hypothetical protein LL667_05065 [Chryseobacterium faecale]